MAPQRRVHNDAHVDSFRKEHHALCLTWRDACSACAGDKESNWLSSWLQFVQTYARASPNLWRETRCLIFHQEALSTPARIGSTCCDVCKGKCQMRQLTPCNRSTNEWTLVHSTTHTHTRSNQMLWEMGTNHFVECNRTNFGSEPLLMRRSLMCKSFSPSARLIRSPPNPAQVQPCSLLHHLSCVRNTVRPLAANKPLSEREREREKHTPACNNAEQTKVERKEKQAEEWQRLEVVVMFGAVSLVSRSSCYS